ncbi:MAG: ATP-dependent RecD-like DNA helicase [Chloroflexi bacterium]|nr:ATP-dependent RecD-like DNA helicase [Chloroflexota bacterium]MDL1882899.1 ATP-dependent RecD-like DNA helicase [Anaerolineae bacterium CFX8]
METLTGSIERITYYNDENGYTVLRLLPDKSRPDLSARDGTVTVVGAMPELQPGEAVEFIGDWVNDPRYGMQFRAEIVKPILPTSRTGIINYLSSGIVKGIGPRTAEKIADYFGDETLHILDHAPERLDEVPGLKSNLAKDLIKAWAENRVMRQIMIFLQGYGITSRMAIRIYGEYGQETIERVKEDPYRLADEVFGIGFIRADAIARSMGVTGESRGRIRAGLFYALNKLALDGHTCAPRAVLVGEACKLLEIENPPVVEFVLNQLVQEEELYGDVIHEDGRPLGVVYLPMYYHSERGVARLLLDMAGAPSALIKAWQDTHWPDFLAELAKSNQVALTGQQQDAVKAALISKLSVLTGGPGTGKTTTLQMVINALLSAKRTFKLASPTGRAAKRLSEATGQTATTIHRMLGYSPDGHFLHDEDYPLEADMVIVDEASMIDLVLFYSLLKALRPTSHLMLVGDIDQLPSVGAGNVLHDVINSGLAHVTRLQTIFRQSEDSLIVVNAHRVNQGQMPTVDNQSRDFFLFQEDDPARAAELVVDLVLNRIPNKFGFDPLDDIQVIAPMYRGQVGVHALNDALQKALNGSPRQAEKKLGGRVFRAGDKVMQTRNNYEKEVFNGDLGRISGINFDDNTLEVVIDGRYIDYDWNEVEELTHAYCISTHRSQGGEYPAVVLPLLTQHYMMLQRNLLYTAITRARRLVVIVGTRKALHIAVSNNKVAERYGGLLPRLRP